MHAVKKYISTLFVLLAWTTLTFSQSQQQKRIEIDAKRSGIDYNSRDALPRGREFKRIDSTYYVGWMFEGTYKYNHAADFLGFKMAGAQLERAVQLMQKDFKKQLKTRTTDVFEFINLMKIHRDWDYITYCLMNCYSNTDDVNKLWSLLQTCKRLDLQDEQFLESYNYLAWTVHRNRFYTSKKFPFLKNSIQENELYANRLLDSSALKIKKDANLNKSFLAIDFEAAKMPGVWHYKSILYSYQLNIESGGYYYEKLKQTPFYPHNNYATFCVIQGKFEEAIQEYNIAKTEDLQDKRMKESFYYLSILNTYNAKNYLSIEELLNIIKANGSTPGYGWYNLALARSYLYNGQIDLANLYLKRAEQFKEIHIGTTLGQSHYDFTTGLLNIIQKQREIDQIKFLDRNWWYSPKALSLIAQKTMEKYGFQFLMINQFATNPERDLVIYKIFSTESTVSFDEVLQLIEGFSTNYFLARFKKEITDEKRYQVKRYYKLFVARLLMKKGNFKEAKVYLQSILNELFIDQAHEKLFLARVHESLLRCNQELEIPLAQTDLNYLISEYPQIIPYSGIPVKTYLITNAKTTHEKEVVEDIKKIQTEWVTGKENALVAYVNFFSKNNTYWVEVYSEFKNKIVIPKTRITYPINDKTIIKKIALAIFGISKKLNDGKK